jgi:hypothetical protein
MAPRQLPSNLIFILHVAVVLALVPSLMASPAEWAAKANPHRGQNGQRFRYHCSPGGPLYNIWGTDVFIDSSSVCTAAVYSGLITQDTGGTVVIEIRPGQDSYGGFMRYGVKSKSYGHWDGSFVFTGERSVGSGPTTTTTWSTTAEEHRGQNGRRFTYQCPGNGEPQPVWGTGIYTDDSSVCSAAVHHGTIGFGGGTVSIEIRSGMSSYRGSNSHGVQSQNYGSFSGSFMFLQ